MWTPSPGTKVPNRQVSTKAGQYHPQRLEVFGWIAGYQRRGFAEEDEVSVHAAELMGRLYDLLDASGYGDHDLDVLLVRLVFIMFADDTSVWEKTNGQRNGPGRRLAAPRSEADIGERLLRPRRDRPSAAGASLRARKRAAYSAARSSRALARWYTFSVVKPNCSNRVPAGAEAP